MNLNKLFPNKKARVEAQEHLISLRETPAWKFISEKIIQADIDEITEELLSPEKEWAEGEEREAKRMRAYWIILRDLPDELLIALKEEKGSPFDDNDPYYKSYKDIKTSGTSPK